MKVQRLDILAVLLYLSLNVQDTFTQSDSRNHHGWGPWSEWSTCNAGCGTGVMSRERVCERTHNGCHGKSVQFKICNTQECSGGQKSLKEQQCSSHDGEAFRGNSRYRWQPYSLREGTCAVVCHPVGQWFYNTFPETYTNGSLCKPNGKHVCIEGECKTFGCDGIIGSHTKMDICGVCGGDNSTCHIVEETFADMELDNGYTPITTIPQGATHIKINQLTRSRNYIALRVSNGPYFINGNRRLSRQGRIEGAGTVFHYHRRRSRRCPAECIVTEGPIEQPVDIMVLAFGLNHGIKYSYAINNNISRNIVTVPPIIVNNDVQNNTATSNVSIVVAPSEPPSIAPTIFIPSGNNKVTADVDMPPPKTTMLNNNERNTNSESNSDRNQEQNGNRRVPGYTQSFDFMDKMKERMNGNSNGHTDHVRPNGNSNRHTGNARPNNHRTLGNTGAARGGAIIAEDDFGGPEAPLADRKPTGVDTSNNVYVVDPNESVFVSGSKNSVTVNGYYRWQNEGFTECSRTCGTGYKTPIVRCVAFSRQVRREKCFNVRPKPNLNPVPCNTRPCVTQQRIVRWDTSPWSSCSVTCGTGEQTRNVQCVQETPSNTLVGVHPSECRNVERPSSYNRCQLEPCNSYRWTLGEWGRCSVTCGSGYRTRSVRCSTQDGRPVNTRHCANEQQPSTREECFMSRCINNEIQETSRRRNPYTWFTSDWTEQCSAECGQGVQRRNVLCLREDNLVTNNNQCRSSSRPDSERSCKNRDGCRSYWFTGPWGRCNATCGEGVQTRSVVCVRKEVKGLHMVVPDFNCVDDDKPETAMNCQINNCQPSWYTSDWNQCSVTCGRGVKTREVRCLDSNFIQSERCGGNSPENQQICSNSPCFTATRSPQTADCVDSYSHCVMVLRTTLCKYKYYEELCCKTCKQAGYPL